MRSSIIAGLGVLALGTVSANGAVLPSSGWSNLALADLKAIHDTISSNHPGPVDPQNPQFRIWLETGLAQADRLARDASTYSDYRRALLFYSNGFHDTHIVPQFLIRPATYQWPGFLARSAGSGAIVSTGGGHAGERIVSCDGKDPDALLRQAIDPFYWNDEVPHERERFIPQLFMVDNSEERFRPKACVFEGQDGIRRTEALRWVDIAPDKARELTVSAAATQVPALDLRQVDALWFISIPTFNFQTDDQVAAFRALLKDVDAHAEVLRQDGFVLDVRGNRGGNSAWGNQLATHLWGEEWVTRIENSFDETVDWRASPANIKASLENAEQAKRNNLPDVEAYRRKIAAIMQDALRRGQPLARMAVTPHSATGPDPARLVTGKVYFLTDTMCDSACLDFADLVRAMPGTIHVGLPTDADALYIDNTTAELPSGIAKLSYSLKVYRHRVRGNNQWLEPQVRWPGGDMTDDAVAKWIKAIK